MALEGAQRHLQRVLRRKSRQHEVPRIHRDAGTVRQLGRASEGASRLRCCARLRHLLRHRRRPPPNPPARPVRSARRSQTRPTPAPVGFVFPREKLDSVVHSHCRCARRYQLHGRADWRCGAWAAGVFALRLHRLPQDQWQPDECRHHWPEPHALRHRATRLAARSTQTPRTTSSAGSRTPRQ